MRRRLSLALLTVALIAGVALPAGAAGSAGEPVPKVGGAWPVGVRPSVVRGWEPPATEYGRGHRGVDLAAAPGSVVRAAAAGRVSFAGRVAGRGVVAVELTGTGDPPLRTTYEPVRATVEKGAEVTAGEALGVLELPRSHCPSSCLHWGLLRGEAYLDPLSLLPPWLLRRGASRLLPVIDVPRPGSVAAWTGSVAAWAGVGLARPGLGRARPGLGLARPGLGLARPGLGLARPGLGLARPGLFPARPGLGLARPGSGLARPGLFPARPGLGLARPGLGLARPGLFPARPGSGLARPGLGLAWTGVALPTADIRGLSPAHPSTPWQPPPP
ncbi:peptidoglycan DD-metalloendopeptidase family protein [Streptomyces sp. BA2]|nr:peptidoglycan DD-metalloendopeptidase family protein [Streptomyces sp. BA2]